MKCLRLSWQSFVFAVAMLSLPGCDIVKNWVGTQAADPNLSLSTSIQGKVDALSSASASLHAHAACVNAKVYLYRLANNGKRIEPFVASADVVNGTFEIQSLPTELGIRGLSSEEPLILIASGCGEIYSRIVTGATNQSLNVASTVAATVLNSAAASTVVQNLKGSRSVKYADLIRDLEGETSPSVLLSKFKTSHKQKYDDLVGGGQDPDDLAEMPPFYVVKEVPSTLAEQQNATFEVDVKHWNPSYVPRIEWRDSSGVLSTLNSFVYTPSKNSQSTEEVFHLLIGEEQAGAFSSNPKFTVSFARIISDTFPAQVPPVVLASASTTRSTTVHLQMSTGAAKVNCDTFSKIAITENSNNPPDGSVFDSQNLTCSTDMTQNISYNLVNTADGLKTLRVWTMDKAGNVSITPAIINMTLDSSAPLLAFSTPAANSSFNAGTTITGTCEVGFNVQVAGAGLTGSQSVACTSPGTFLASISFTAGDGTKTVSISQTDLASNTVTANRNFILDTVAPSLTLDTPAANTSAQTGLTITGTCENGISIALSGAGLQSPSSATCASGVYSQAILFTSGDGVKAITVTQTDLAGNSTSASRNFVRDNVAPVLVVSSPAASTSSQGSATISGTCESGSSNLTLSGDLTGPASTACTAGSFSVAVTFSAGEGSKTINFAQSDAAGNIGTTSITLVNDNTPPALTFTAPAANTPAQTGVTITGTCEGTLSITISGAGLSSPSSTACSSGSFSQAIVFTAGDGNKVITVSQTDAAGNTGSANRTFVKDTTAPSLSYLTPAANTPAQTGVTITGNCETGLTVNLSGAGLSSPSTTTCSAGSFSQSVTFTAGEGTKTIVIGQTDLSGNSASVSRDFIRDNTGPTLAITSPAANASFQGSALIDGTCEIGGSALTISGNVTAPASTTCSGGGTFSVTVTFAAGEGAKTVTFSQNDVAGNTGTISINLINDNTAPVLTFVSPLAGASGQASITITGTCEGVLPITIGGAGLDTPTSTTCNFGSFSQSITFTVGDGNKTISVSQTDAAGNTGSSSRTFVRDTLAPAISITGPAANTQAQNGVTLTGTCENGITIQLSGTGLSSPATTTCSSGTFSQAITFTSGDGTKNIVVSQTDLAGNSASANRDFVKDTVAPSLTITGPAAGTAAQSNITLTGACETGVSITYGGSGILTSFSGACTAGTYSQMVFFSAGDGTKTLSVTQTDPAGNSTTVSRNFERDNVGPNLTQTALAFPHYANTNTVNFGGACETGLTVNVKLAGTGEGSASCTAGAWTYTTAAQTSDGTYNYTFEQTDQAGNLTSTSGRFIRDTVAPSITFTSSSSQLTASNSVTFSGNCESGLPAAIVVAGGTDSTTTTCSSGTWSYTVATQTTDGTRTYTFRQTDQAGNATTITGTWERNTAVPNLLITTSTPLYNGGNTAHVDGVCEAGLDITIKLSGSTEATIPCSLGIFSYDFAAQTSDSSRTYEFKQTNALLLSTTQNFTWVRDTTAPTITAASFSINSGAATTGRANVRMALQATDSLSKITKFCFKTGNTTQPSTNDSCWIDVETGAGLTAALTLNLSNYSFNLPIVPDNYSVYAWVRDQVGNASVLTNSGLGTMAQDRDDITLQLAVPPTINYVLVGSTDFPANPPSTGDLTAGVGSPIFIKWKASDDVALPGTPVAIYFTTDDSTWTLVANNLINGSNGSCLVNNPSTPADNDATGCYKLTAAPTGGYLKFRVMVTDSDSLMSAMSSTGMNIASTLKFLAGNTDPGTNLSAAAAMFFYRRMENFVSRDTHTLAVDNTGTVYFKDAIRGIIKVDPTDGVARIFLAQTGVSSGDNGPVSSATATNIIKMTLDHNTPVQRLWIYDNNRIRRVDLATGIITTVIGGSGSDDSDTVANPLNARVDWPASDPDGWHGWMPFFSLPNGDFYFQAGNDGYYESNSRVISGKYRIRYLEASSGTIKSYRPTNITSTRAWATGTYNDCQIRGLHFGFDFATSAITDRLALMRSFNGWTYCSFADQGTFASLDASGATLTNHPVSPTGNNTANLNEWFSSRVGLDGKLYLFSKANYGNGLFRYNGAPTYDWTRLIGDGSNQIGYCADNTDALSCRAKIADVWVTSTGTIYFLDDGMIRTVTPANKIVTLMGQGQLSGIGGPASSARLSTYIRTFRTADDGRITFGTQAQQLLELDPNGGLFYQIAGNGAIGPAALGVDSNSTFLNLEHPNGSGEDFGMDPVTGDIYHHAGGWRIAKLTRNTSSIGSTGTWSQLIGGGTNNWITSDGLSNIGFTNNCAAGMDTANYTFWTCWILPKVLHYSNGKIITQFSNLARRNSNNAQSPYNNMLKLYDATSTVQTHLLGRVGHNSTGNGYDSIATDGTSGSAADFWSADWSRVATPYNVSGDRWLFSRFGDNNYKRIYDITAGGTLQTLATLPSGPRSFAYRNNGTDEYIYYCSVLDNRIHRFHVQSSTDTLLSWPVTGMRCVGSAMFYKSASESVVFSYQLNGLMGFAEYLDDMP